MCRRVVPVSKMAEEEAGKDEELRMGSSSNDWQFSCRSVLDRNKFLFGKDIMSDVAFIIEDPDQNTTRIPAHKFVVGSGSPVFQAMFYGLVRDSSDEITIRDSNAASFRNMLWYLYSDEFNTDEVQFAEVIGRLDLARKYMIPELAKLCMVYFKQNLGAHSVLQVLESARLLRLEALEAFCWRLVEEKTADLLSDPSFLSTSQDLLEMVLKRTKLNATEKDLFVAVYRWAENECERKQLENSAVNKRKVIGTSFYNIHFSAMSHEEFANVVVPTAVLTNEEALQIFLSMSSEIPPEIAFPTLPRMRPASEAVPGSWCIMGVPPEKCIQFGSGRFVDRLEIRPNRAALLTAIEFNEFAMSDLPKASVNSIVLRVTTKKRGFYTGTGYCDNSSSTFTMLDLVKHSPVADELVFTLERPFKLSSDLYHLVELYWRGSHAPLGHNRKIKLPEIETVSCDSVTLDVKNHIMQPPPVEGPHGLGLWQYLQWSLIKRMRFAAV